MAVELGSGGGEWLGREDVSHSGTGISRLGSAKTPPSGSLYHVGWVEHGMAAVPQGPSLADGLDRGGGDVASSSRSSVCAEVALETVAVIGAAQKDSLLPDAPRWTAGVAVLVESEPVRLGTRLPN